MNTEELAAKEAADKAAADAAAAEASAEAPTPEEIAELRKKATAFEDQKKRAEIAEGELKKFKTPKVETPAPNTGEHANDDNVTRARLEARGYLDEDAQDLILQAAKVLGIDPIKAPENEIVKGQLAALKAKKATNDATPAPSRGGGTTTNISRLADKALETGELPSDPALKAQVKAEMKRRGK